MKTLTLLLSGLLATAVSIACRPEAEPNYSAVPADACKPINTTYKESKTALIANIKANLPADASLKGDEKGGTITATKRPYELITDYKITGDTIIWNVKKKPGVLSCQKVEKTIKELLEDIKGPGGIASFKSFDLFKYIKIKK